MAGTEAATCFIHAQAERSWRSDTVAFNLRGVELKIADNGRCLTDSPGVFVE